MKTSWKIERGTKDFSGRYININTDLLHHMGYKKKTQVIGRSEYDIGREVFSDSLCNSDMLVDDFLKSDEEAFRGRELSFLDVHLWYGQLRFRVARKYPSRNQKGKIIGASHVACEIYQPSVHEIQNYLALEKNGLNINETSRIYIQQYLNELLKPKLLSSRELECVNLLAKGKTAKEIAQILKLSNRTVEFYLDNARTKLQCANRYELIYKCFENGWLS